MLAPAMDGERVKFSKQILIISRFIRVILARPRISFQHVMVYLRMQLKYTSKKICFLFKIVVFRLF